MTESTHKEVSSTKKTVESFIRLSNIPPKEKLCQGILVALSGGADSVALLMILSQLGYKCIAVHCNFKLRAEESYRDEEFVKKLCKRMEVPLYIKHFDTTEWALQHHLSVETAARELRYKYFSSLGHELGINHIAVGHHMDDDVETIMLNIIRGAGLNGLKGMQPVTTNNTLCKDMVIIRPMLLLTHNGIVTYLRNVGQTWVDDSTNFKDDFARNKIRLSVFPILEEINPAVKSNIISMKKIMCEVSQVYKSAIGNDITACATKEFTVNACDNADSNNNNTYTPLIVDICKLRQTKSPMCVLYELLSPVGFNGEQLIQILASARPGATFRSKTHIAVIDRGRLIVRPLTHANDENAGVLPHPLLSDTRFRVDYIDVPVIIEKRPSVAYIDTNKIKSSELHVRQARRGDSIAPFGMNGKRKLVSDILTDAKVNILDKRNQLLIMDAEEIVWVIGHRTSELYKIDDSTKRILKIEFVGTRDF